MYICPHHITIAYKNSSASSSHFLMELWKITFGVFISWLLEFRSSSSSVLSHFLPQLVCFKIETWPSEKVQSSTQSSANHLVTFRDAHSFRTSSFRNTPFQVGTQWQQLRWKFLPNCKLPPNQYRLVTRPYLKSGQKIIHCYYLAIYSKNTGLKTVSNFV